MPPHSAAVARRLGSRLYFEFTAAALSDDTVWEGLSDSVAVEVQRHGAPASRQSDPAAITGPAQVAARDGVGEVAAQPAVVLPPTALATPAPAHGVAATALAGMGMTSIVSVDNRNTVNNTNTNTNNSTNSSNSVRVASNFGISNTCTNNIVML